MVRDLEFQAEAYVAPPHLSTNFELGFVNFTQARWLALWGWLEYPDMEGPLRLTQRARDYFEENH